MKRALLFVYLDTHFIELARVADLLRSHGWRIVFLFAYRYPSVADDIERCRREGYECLDAAGAWIVGAPPALPKSGAVPARPGIGRRLLARLRAVGPLRRVLSPWSPKVAILLQHYRNEQALAARIVAAARPDLLVLPEDNVEYITGRLVHAAKARGAATVVVPYTMVNAEEIAEAYWHNPDYWPRTWCQRLVCRLFPRWVHVHRGRRLMRMPTAWILAFEILRIAPPKPWIVNSGDADAIAVEGPFMYDYYVKAGLPPRQLQVTGALYDDLLHRSLQQGAAQSSALRSRLGIGNDRPVLLCALPPDQFPSGRPGAEYASYKEMLRDWAAVLAGARDYEVLLRLHPRTLRRDVSFLEGEFGLRIIAEDTAALIPLCDVYAASVSATIRLAIACGKPVINYDCYRFRYSDFKGIAGVVTVENLDGFRAQLARLAHRTERERFAQAQREFAARSNLIDGRCSERMLALFDRLISAAAH